MQHRQPSGSAALRATPWLAAALLLVLPGAGATNLLLPDGAHHPDTGCGDSGANVAVGQERADAMDPVADTEDALVLAVGTAWQDRGVQLSVSAGKESVGPDYTLRVDVFASADCAGPVVKTATVAAGHETVVAFTPSSDTVHSVRFTVDAYGGSSLADKTAAENAEGHCFPHCAIDWWLRYTLGQLP